MKETNSIINYIINYTKELRYIDNIFIESILREILTPGYSIIFPIKGKLFYDLMYHMMRL